MEDLRITLVQAELHWENPTSNRLMFEKHFSAFHEETDILVLPEMFTTGFTMNASANAETMNGETMEWMRIWTKKKECVILGSLIIRDNGRYFNRLIWMKPDGNFETYDKRHLFRLSGEEKVYSLGNKKLIEIIGDKLMFSGINIFGDYLI